jgi:hypothetical protein
LACGAETGASGIYAGACVGYEGWAGWTCGEAIFGATALDGTEDAGIVGAAVIVVLSCIGQFSLKEIKGSIDVWCQVEPGVCQHRQIRRLWMRDLLQIGNERQERPNALLGGLRHSEWIAVEHSAAFFVGFIREEVPQCFDAIHTELLQVPYDNA